MSVPDDGHVGDRIGECGSTSGDSTQPFIPAARRTSDMRSSVLSIVIDTYDATPSIRCRHLL